MPAREIKATLKLDGESKFRQAINGSKKEMAALRAEMKAQTTEFLAQGNAQKAAEARAESLKKQQEEQEEVVRALTQALEEANEMFADAPDKIANYRTQLANAQTYLSQLTQAQREAADEAASFGDEMTSSSKEVEDAAGGAEDGLEGIQEALEVIQANTGFTALCNGLELVQQAAQAAFDVVKQLYDTVNKSSEWADTIATLSVTTGIDTKTLQQMYYASNLVDTSVDDIIGSINKLRSNMDNDSKMVDLGTALGVNAYDVNGQLKDAESYFWEIIKVANQMGVDLTKDTKMANTFMDVFGKGATELQPLINGVDQYQEAMKEAEKSGVVLDDQQLGNLTSYNDGLVTLQANITALGNVWSSTLAPVFSEFNTGMTTVIQEINAWLKDEGLQTTIQSIADGVKGVFETIQALVDGDMTFADLFAKVKGWFKIGDTEEDDSFGKAVISYVKESLSKALTAVTAAVDTITAEEFVGTVGGFMATVLNGLGTVLAGVFQFVNSEEFTGALSSILNNVLTAGSAMITAFVSELDGTTIADNISLALGGLLNAFVAAVKGLMDFSTSTAAQEMLDGVTSFVCDLFDQLVNNLLDWIKEKFGVDYQLFDDPYKGAGQEYITTPQVVAQDVNWTVSQNQSWVDWNNAIKQGRLFANTGDYEAAMKPLEDYAKDNGIEVDVSEMTYLDAYNALCAAILAEEPAQLNVEVSETSEGNIPIELQNAINGKTYTMTVNALLGGIGDIESVIPGHADGLDYVPYDNYVARLHRGEAVLTAEQAGNWRSGGGFDVDALAVKIASAMSGVQVVMDGNAVGRAVAPSVDSMLARIIGA